MPSGLAQPLFSIGVTAYRRSRLLQEALDSLAAQSWRDFEVIVGNDDPAVPLQAEQFGVRGQRWRFVNHPRNLGEVGNMNALLASSRGRYFTWLADDDAYVPEFLAEVAGAIDRFKNPPCVVTNYFAGALLRRPAASGEQPSVMTGVDFLLGFLEQRLRAIGTYAVFERTVLQRFGGATHLGGRLSVYTDNFLAHKIGLLDRVVYVPEPLVWLRTHEQSISWVSTDVSIYRQAQEALCSESVKIWRQSSLMPHFDRLLYQLLRVWCVSYYYKVVRRSSLSSLLTLPRYWRFIWRESRRLSRWRLKLLATVVRSTFWLAIDTCRQLAWRRHSVL